jgi:hypothetical protein
MYNKNIIFFLDKRQLYYPVPKTRQAQKHPTAWPALADTSSALQTPTEQEKLPIAKLS